MRYLILLIVSISCLSCAETEWPAVPDPVGLGPRLALIDWLRERGVAVRAGAKDDEILAAYRALAPSDPVRNRHRLARIATDRSGQIAALARSSAPRVAAWTGDWAEPDAADWTDHPNLAGWTISLSYLPPANSDRDAGGGLVVVTTPVAEAVNMGWMISASNGQVPRDDGEVDGIRRWTLRLVRPPVEPIVIVASAARRPEARRTWSVRYTVDR